MALFTVQSPAWGIQFFTFLVLTFLLQIVTVGTKFSHFLYILMSHQNHRLQWALKINYPGKKNAKTYNSIPHASSLFPPIESKYRISFLRKSTTCNTVAKWFITTQPEGSYFLFHNLNSLKTYREAPVHPQVDRNQKDVFRKDVSLFGPSANSRIATAAQLRIEKCVEGIHWWQARVLAALHQHVHVKVDHLSDWGGESFH